ncbi:outer membrane protein [Mailhella sp.]|uniref:outer membrane protein n=1 Tax=Mailhella sp. TaxID=1981029 RepID=UPI003AB8C6F4
MKNVIVIIFVWIGIMISSSLVYAADNSNYGVYLAPKFTVSVLHTRGTLDLAASTWGPRRVFGVRAGGALALGYDFWRKFQVPLRVELEYGATESVSKTASVKVFRRRFPFRAKIGVQTLLVNAYVDIPNSSGFTPYIGAGAGMAFLDVKGNSMGLSASGHATVPAGQLGLGCSYAFNKNVSVDMGYRFVIMRNTDASCEFIRLNLQKNYMHQIMLGLRITF